MRKWVLVGTACALSFAAAIVAYILQGEANGYVLVGERDQIQSDIEHHKENLKSTSLYPVKRIMINGEKLMIMDKATAEVLVNMRLLEKVNKEGNDSIPIKSLPAIISESGIIWAKTKMDNISIQGTKKVNLTYHGNVIIGIGRTFADMFAVVDPSILSSIKGKEEVMGVLHFKNMPEGKRAEFTTKELRTVTIR